MAHEAGQANRYLYEQIYSELKKEILSGMYRRGDWFPPERVLKERFNTTHLTVRNALAKLVLEGYIERYSGKGTIVIYTRESASPPRKLLSFPWAHLIVESLDEANAAILELLEAQLRRVPLALRLSFHRGDVLLGQGLYREARESGALVVLQSLGAGFAQPPLGNTIVIRDTMSGAGCPQVVIDHVQAGREAARYLLRLGHRRIAVLGTLASAGGAGLDRGVLEELAAAGLAEAGQRQACGHGVDAGRLAVQDALHRDPSCRAFLCHSDLIAAGAVSGLALAGMTAGRDCAVIGWGNTPLAQGMRLTSIDPRFDLLAERTLAVVLEGMASGSFAEGIFPVSPELRIRDSSDSVP